MMRSRLLTRARESMAVWGPVAIKRSAPEASPSGGKATVRSTEPPSAGSESAFDIANKARVDWTIHLHQQIHQYLRQAATLQQIGLVAVVTSTGLAFQFLAIRPVLLIFAPYFIGVLILAFGSHLREVFVAAAFIEHYEAELAHDLGRQVLIVERVLGSSPPNKFGTLMTDLCLLVLFLLSIGGSVYYSAQKGMWPLLGNCALLTLLLATVIVSFVELRRARARVKNAAATLGATPS